MYQCNSGCGYSKLENVVYSSNASYSSQSSSYSSGDLSYMVADAQPVVDIGGFYDSDNQKTGYSAEKDEVKAKPVTRTYFGFSDSFLDRNRPRTVFVGDASELKEFAEETFRDVTGKEFPDDIVIRLLSKDEFIRANSAAGGKWNNGIQGFAVNRKRFGMSSEIFVRKGELDKIMLTLGHEIGHVLTRTLENKKDEEAKAFAFSIEWMKKIKELNIANLSTAICLDRPAQNGLHDVSLDFVLKKIQEGKGAYGVFEELISGSMRVEE